MRLINNEKMSKSHDFLYNIYLDHENHNQWFRSSKYTLYQHLEASPLATPYRDTLGTRFPMHTPTHPHSTINVLKSYEIPKNMKNIFKKTQV